MDCLVIFGKTYLFGSVSRLVNRPMSVLLSALCACSILISHTCNFIVLGSPWMMVSRNKTTSLDKLPLTHSLGPHFFIFRFTSPPTLQNLTRHEIKIPIIYFLFPMGRFIFPKSTNFFYKTCKQNGKCQFYFYIYALRRHQEFVRDCRKTKN